MSRHSYFFLFVFLFSAGNIFSQRSSHYIRNYLPREYKGFNQMWQMTQDENGLMYFAGTSDVFVYDGLQWESVKIKNGAANRQIVRDSATGIIYVGAVDEFGYLERNANGKLHYVSLSAPLDSVKKVFTDVWKIYCLGGKTYFQSSERIFVVKDKKVISTVEPSGENDFALSFTDGKDLYVRERNVGFMKVTSDGKLLATPGGEIFSTLRLLGMIPWKKNEQLLLTGDRGFYLMNDRTDSSGSFYHPFKSDSFLVNSGVLGCLWVNDSTIAVNTRSGIGFYDRQFHLKEIINKTSGLADESIAALYLDREKNIWVAHNNGLTCIAYNSTALFYDDKSGYTGTPCMVYRFNGILYLATSQGLFKKEELNKNNADEIRFVPAATFQTEVWDVRAHMGELFVATSEGLYWMHDGKEEMLNSEYTDYINCSDDNKTIVTGEKGSFSVFEHERGKKPVLVKHYIVAGDELLRMSRIHPAAGEKNIEQVWAVNRFKNILKINFNLNDSVAAVTRYDTSNGLKNIEHYFVESSDTVYFFDVDLAMRYVPALDHGAHSKCFITSKELFDRLYELHTEKIDFPIDNRLNLQAMNDVNGIYFGAEKEKVFAVRYIAGSLFEENGIQFALAEPDHKLWLLSNDLILHAGTADNNRSKKNVAVIIRYVSIGKDSVIMQGTDSSFVVNENEIAYKFNSIAFRYAAPYFMFNEQPKFSYRLDGLDTNWSAPSNSFTKEYNNLGEGTYTFRVRATNELGMIAREATYTFTILPPWYRTWWAYSFYILSFIGLFWISIRISARRLRMQKQKLEVLVSERTAEVVFQKQQIEKQKTELETAYTEIQDSIHYAERIQNAILPVQYEMAAHLPEAFVFFRPRNIVSGDFYWYTWRDNKSFLACVDCTGHGVPGAFMSLIGNTLLNQIIIEKKTDSPDQVLNMLHEGVRHSLKQDTGGETRDGMDIAFVIIDHEKNELHYAGANRALWYVRDGNFNEIKADKFPIAGDQFEEKRIFSGHTVEMKKGDVFYLSTDGYADQFGGERGKKFMVKQFQKVLLGIAGDDMKQQRSIIEKSFLHWKGEHDQVDDVLVIGFRYLN
ncbi:MAG: SpoIIE family protein phosphatase [Bacteroidetes bacterium]|nr:SpoIIE family protein phosphatase [Bacteroidota bacterium]